MGDAAGDHPGRCDLPLAAHLAEALQGQGVAVKIVPQDKFWFRAVRVQLPGGAVADSQEEPECTNWDRFWDCVQCTRGRLASTGGGTLIAEGFQVLHDGRMRDAVAAAPAGTPAERPADSALCFHLDLPKALCIERRSAPCSPANPNPCDVKYCTEILWPAAERYVARSVDTLGSAVTRIDATQEWSELCDKVLGAVAAARRPG
eukprot:TRINITY_DN12950_c0_g1_i2.p1 TRINITY_DN12950_c0_g1~~TRINITY_DN12950_c0_g1_i2.p1  ORF type:complete len:212 (+),score=53.78 TRINITY_DN12950_c0_g1_i2:27-638(+)